MYTTKKLIFFYNGMIILFWQNAIGYCAPACSKRTVSINLPIIDDVTIVTRAEWDARLPKSTRHLNINPPPFVVIHHSATNSCYTDENCTKLVKSIQNYHMDHNKWEDIGYNFLVGGNGEIFEGRGWGIHGAHCPVFNSRSIGICLLGNFVNKSATIEQIQATTDLIAFGVNNSFIADDYRLVGHRQGSPTECPGQKLFDQIQQWPHYDPTKYNLLKRTKLEMNYI